MTTDAPLDSPLNGCCYKERCVENERRLTALQADAERLDFAESMRATIYRSETGSHWVFVDERAKKRKGCLGDSVRGCIDAARKAAS